MSNIQEKRDWEDLPEEMKNPYSDEQMMEILGCLGFSDYSDTESQTYADIIGQTGLRYQRNQELDKNNNRDGDKNENETLRKELVKLEKTRKQQAAPINSLLKKIERKAASLQKLIDQFEDIPNSYLYLSSSQERAFARLKSFGTMLQNNPLPRVKDKTGTEDYPALNTFVRELKELYERKTGQKGVAYPEAQYKKDGKSRYGNLYHTFMCACILPLCNTHPTMAEIGDYVSNFNSQ